MKYHHFFILVAFSFVQFGSYSQNNSEYRVVKYVNLKEKENRSLYFDNNALVNAIFDAIDSHALKPIKVDFENDQNSKILTVEEVKKMGTMVVEADPNPDLGIEATSVLTFEKRDYSILGIDKSIIKDGTGVKNRFNYLHIYLDGAYYRGYNEYMFSLKWEDFLFFLNTKSNLKVLISGTGCEWWKNELFYLKNSYISDLQIIPYFISLGKRHPELLKTPQNLEAFSKEPYELEIAFTYDKPKSKGGFSIKEMRITKENTYNNDQFDLVFDWTKLLKFANDSGWTSNSKIVSPLEIFEKEQFKYNTDTLLVSSKTLTKNNANITTVNTSIVKNLYKVPVLEMLNLKHPYNSHLKNIANILYENLVSGKITPYSDHTCTTKLTKEEVNLSLFYLSGNCMALEDILNGDEAQMSGIISKGLCFMSEGEVWTVVEDIPVQEVKDKQKLKKKIVPYAKYSPKDLRLFELQGEYVFDENGTVKDYKVFSVGLFVPADMNIKGIQYPVCFVTWEDLQKIMASDSRSKVQYNKKKNTLANLVEKRQFFPLLYKSGLVESVK